VIEIQKTVSANRKQSRSTKFITATVLNINQTSKFKKVEVAYENLSGTQSVDLTKTRWRLPGPAEEEGVFYINELNELVMLKEPKSWKAIQRIPDKIIREKWEAACKAEMDGIRQQGVYKLVDRPAGVKCIPLIWVFKIKQPKAGELIGRFKARCCLLGNVMEQSDQSYASPTPKLSTLRYALSWAAKTGAAVWSADVEQAFLLAPPAEPVYCSFPPGFEDPNGKVMFLLKNLYGSTTAPYMFNTYLSNSLILQGFTPSPYDPCLFTKMVNNSLMIVICYVDDSVAIHSDPKVLDEFYKFCETPEGGGFKFGQLEHSITRFLGFDIVRTDKGFILSQIPLIDKIFSIAKPWMAMHSSDLVTTTPIAKDTVLEASVPPDPSQFDTVDKVYLSKFPYREILGATGDVALGTRPDISFSYKTHGKWSSCYNRAHCESLLALVRYMYQTKNQPLILCNTPGPLIGKSDADWNGSSGALSTSGWIVFHGSAPISWASRTNKASAKSTAEAEFMSMSSLAIELIYIKRLVESIHNTEIPAIGLIPRVIDKSDISSGQRPLTIDDNAVSVLRTQEGLCLDMPAPLTIFTDSLAGKAATEKQWASDRMRHIRHSLYFIKHYIASGDIKLAYMPGADLCADILTKAFGSKTGAQGQQMEGFVKHRREILGQFHYRAQINNGVFSKLIAVDNTSAKPP
jgi:hypothetical protein